MKLHRVLAIFEKDLKEFMRNMSLFTMILLPIIMALLFTNIGGGIEDLPLEIIFILIGMTFSAISYNTMATMMAEENEKDTLRGLVQSPASLIDIILGKSLVTILMTLISLGISLAICDAITSWSFMGIIALILLLLFFLGLGIAVGLSVKSVATTAIYTMPIMFIFGVSQYVEFIVTDPNSIVRKVFNYLPIYQVFFIEEGQPPFKPLMILLVWVILVFIIVFWTFKKRSKDDKR